MQDMLIKFAHIAITKFIQIHIINIDDKVEGEFRWPSAILLPSTHIVSSSPPNNSRAVGYVLKNRQSIKYLENHGKCL
jgi:hypothetical protein